MWYVYLLSPFLSLHKTGFPLWYVSSYEYNNTTSYPLWKRPYRAWWHLSSSLSWVLFVSQRNFWLQGGSSLGTSRSLCEFWVIRSANLWRQQPRFRFDWCVSCQWPVPSGVNRRNISGTNLRKIISLRFCLNFRKFLSNECSVSSDKIIPPIFYNVKIQITVLYYI